MLLTLTRDTSARDYTQGVMQVGSMLFQTIELPWIPDPQGLGGCPDLSCVPVGTYELHLHDSPKHPHSFALQNLALDVSAVEIPEKPWVRSECLIHVANYANQLLGCIGIGLSRAPGVIMQSVLAMDRFNELVPWIPGHTLTIA